MYDHLRWYAKILGVVWMQQTSKLIQPLCIIINITIILQLSHECLHQSSPKNNLPILVLKTKLVREAKLDRIVSLEQIPSALGSAIKVPRLPHMLTLQTSCPLFNRFPLKLTASWWPSCRWTWSRRLTSLTRRLGFTTPSSASLKKPSACLRGATPQVAPVTHLSEKISVLKCH